MSRLTQGSSVVVLVAALLAVVAARAQAQPGLLLGVDDDALRWTSHPAPLQRALHDLGVGAIRFTQQWRPGESRIPQAEGQSLARAVVAAQGLRIVLSVYGKAGDAPQDHHARAQYCAFVRSILVRFTQIRDVVIWNEVNSSTFWRPQFDAAGRPAAPAAYEALLAACYGTLHSARPGLNVISSLAPRGNDDPRTRGSSGIPAPVFLRALGDAYRASGRRVKLVDTFGQNVYPRTTREPPAQWHDRSEDVSEGDYARLIASLHDAFAGTGQPLPGSAGVTVWYLEDGFQTAVPRAKAHAYRGRENEREVVPAGSIQAAQLTAAIRLAYCQPGVGAFFNFMLADEHDLAGWQSGLLWADLTRKPSFGAVAAVVRQVAAGAVDCGSAAA